MNTYKSTSVPTSNNMKITSVAVFTADVELAEEGLRLSGGRVRQHLVTTIVRLDTDAGISGFGEV